MRLIILLTLLKIKDLIILKNFTDSDKRITLISPDGDVIADTSADESKLDDHSDRQEVADAMKTDRVQASVIPAHSAEKTVYYAMKNE